MSSQHDDQTEHHHFYVTPEVLPKPDDSTDEWIRRVTMLGELLGKMTESVHTLLGMYAPVLIGPDQPFSHMLGGIGLVCLGIATTGRQQLEKTGTEPLSIKDDQLRIVRDQLAKPGLDPELREALLHILAINLEERGEVSQPADFPDEGFVIGGE